MPARRASSVYSAFTSWSTRGGVDAGSRAERTASGSSTRSRADAGSIAVAESGAASGARATALAGSAALRFGACLLQHADAIAVVGGRRHDRRNDNRQRLRRQWRRLRFGRRGDRLNRFRRLTLGQRTADLLADRRASPSAVVLSPAVRRRRPPPPGPGVSRKTRRIGSGTVARGSSTSRRPATVRM